MELKKRTPSGAKIKNDKEILKTKDFIITTHNEIDVCREALSTVTQMTEKLKQLIHDTKEDINMKQADASKVMADELQTALKDALDELSNNGEIKKLEQAMKLINAKVDRLDSDYKQLKTEDFIKTTHNQIKVCREALSTVTQMTEKLKQLIHDTKEDINMKQADASKVMADELQTALKDALDELSNNGEIKKLEQAMKLIFAKVDSLDSDYKQRLSKIEDDITAFQHIGNQKKTTERLEYLENKQKLQDELVKYYKKYHVNTSLSPLKQQQDSINVNDIYVPPEIEVIEEKKDMDRRGGETARNFKLHSAKEEQDKILNNRIPGVVKNQLDKDQYRRMEYESVDTDKGKPVKKTLKGYHDLFQTKIQGHKKIYILGDVGTGKSTFCKMIIENWCNAIKSSTNESIRDENGHDATKTVTSDVHMASEYDDTQYEFLFYIPLQFMSAFKSDAMVEMIKELTRDLTSNTELIDQIFQEDSMRCLIIADSLDEWTPPKETMRKPHVSYGIPNGDRAKDATVITLSRPSAIGILNLKNSEVDLKLKLLGISCKSLRSFIERYISNTQVTNKTYDGFIAIIETKQIKHVEKTPLFLQQLLWLYCNGIDIGKSVCETYCQILNTMCGWSDRRKDQGDKNVRLSGPMEDYNNLNRTQSLNRFPRIKRHIRVLFRLGRVAYETFTSDNVQATFGLSMFEKYLSKDDIKELTDLGILNKSTCFCEMLEDTHFSFIHISYIEFLAALYIAIYYCMEQTGPVIREDSVLNLLFFTCKSISDVVQLSNVIKMVCGLSPDLIGDLSKRISCIVNKDERILKHRKNNYPYNSELFQIQRLMFNCLNECYSDMATIISLSDLYIHGDEPIPPLQRIKPEYVISMSIEIGYKFGEMKYVKDMQKYVTQCKHMQNMYVSCLNQDELERCPLSFSGNVSLKQMSLNFLRDCDIHLSIPNKLQALTLYYCSRIDIPHLDTEQLKRITIYESAEIDISCFLTARNLTDIDLQYSIDMHVDITLVRSILQQAPFLRQLSLYDLYDHIRNDYKYIDLSRHHQLQNVWIRNCPRLVITKLNTEQLEDLFIDNSNCYEIATDISVRSLEFTNSSARKLRYIYLHGVIVNIASLVPLLRGAPLQRLIMINVSDSQQAVESHIKRLADNDSVFSSNFMGESDQPNCEGHLRGVSDIHCVVDGQIERVANNQSVVPSHLRDVSDQPGGEVHLRSFSCAQPVVEGHVIDLSMQNKLMDLKIISCDHIKISNINSEQLVHIDLVDTTIPVFESSIPSNTSNLITIHLEDVSCDKKALLSLLQHTNVKILVLARLHVNQSMVQDRVQGIDVDLSKLNQLQFIKLSSCKNIKISDLNTTELLKVHIIDCCGILDFRLLSNADQLAELCVEHNTSDAKSQPLVLQQGTCSINIDINRLNNYQSAQVFILNGLDCRSIIPILKFCIPSNRSITLHLKDLTCDMSLLVSSLQQNIISHLALTSVYGDQSAFEGNKNVKHVDLSKQNQLQILKLSNCKNIKIFDINTDMLEHLHIENCSDVLEFDHLSNASKLVKLHCIDVTCNTALVVLFQTVTFRQLKLKNVSADKSIVEGDMHVVRVNLSKQSQLQVLELSHCKNITISDLNTQELEKVHIGYCPGILDFGHLLNARKLTDIYLYGNTFQYNKQIDDVMHTLHQLRNLTLHDVHIDDKALTVTSEMKSLENISLNKNAKMSLETWYTFIDSLLVLHQSVEVTTNDKTQEQKLDYVKTNPNFKVVRDDDYFRFESRAERKNSK